MMGSSSTPAGASRRRVTAIVFAALLVLGMAAAVVAVDLDSAPSTVASQNVPMTVQ